MSLDLFLVVAVFVATGSAQSSGKVPRCDSKLAFCYLRDACIGCNSANTKENNMCRAKCAVCLDKLWGECCEYAGLCSRDRKTMSRGQYRQENRKTEKGLFASVASAIVYQVKLEEVSSQYTNVFQLELPNRGECTLSEREPMLVCGKRTMCAACACAEEIKPPNMLRPRACGCRQR